jgi:hypothetical protein
MNPSIKNAYGRRLESLANIAIIVCSLVLLAVVWKRQFPPQSRTASPRVGQKLALGDVDWSQNHHTLLLALRTDCRFCTESADFYRRLLGEVDRSTAKPHVIAVLPQPIGDARSYLSHLGIAVSDVRQASLTDLNIQGTPTLLLIGDSGRIISVWVGRLHAPTEGEVLAAVRSAQPN